MMSSESKNSPLADIGKVLVSEAQIKKRIRELASEITDHYRGEELAVIAIINGAIVFVADLIRELPLPVKLDCIRVSSYRNETAPQGRPEVIDRIRLNLEGVHVLLIDDILDTGNTLAAVSRIFEELKPASLKTCVLLDKKARRSVEFEADFVGFQIPDEFVVGYGLDFAERYRHLPCIGVLRADLQNPPEWS